MTRGRVGRGWTLVTPGNHYVSRLPGLRGASVVKLVTPRLAPSRIAETLVTLEPGGGTSEPLPGPFEHFLFGLDGAATVVLDGAEHPLGSGAHAYAPEGVRVELRNGPDAAARLLWLKRRYEPWPGLAPPAARCGHVDDAPWAPTAMDGLVRRELLPVDDGAFDFAMSLLRFAPGTSLPFVEIHDEEHGLYMTRGAGLYALDREEHPVQAGDFISMAPYCPQSFTASADGGAEYLLYKDAWRDGF